MYYYGEVEALDESELARIRAEAERGYAEAQYALGLVLAMRDGVKHGDWAEAVKWYRFAARMRKRMRTRPTRFCACRQNRTLSQQYNSGGQVMASNGTLRK